MISFWRRRAITDLVAEIDHLRTEGLERSNLLASTQDALRNRLAELQQWQEHAGKLFTDNESLRRDAEHWRNSYEAALETGRHEREKYVQHLVDLKREGFGVGGAGTGPIEPPTLYPDEIQRAIGMRSFDANTTRANNAYAAEQLRLRPDAASEIAKEILAGEQFDTYDDSEVAAGDDIAA